MSDKRDGAGSPVDDDDDVTDADSGVSGDVSDVEASEAGSTRGGTAVATRPQRPTGKRARRETTDAVTPATDGDSVKNGDGKKKKTAKKSGPPRNPITYVWNYLVQVVAELRKVIWPNRKQMVSYTTVVLVFLAFMVALIGGVDLGLAKLVTWVFG